MKQSYNLLHIYSVFTVFSYKHYSIIHTIQLFTLFLKKWMKPKALPGAFPLHRLIEFQPFKENIFKLHTITPQCFGFNHLNNHWVMVRKTTRPHMGRHSLTTVLHLPQVSLVQAIAIHVGGKRRIQERFEALPQELSSDGM